MENPIARPLFHIGKDVSMSNAQNFVGTAAAACECVPVPQACVVPDTSHGVTRPTAEPVAADFVDETERPAAESPNKRSIAFSSISSPSGVEVPCVLR